MAGAWSRAKLTKDTSITTGAMMWACGSASNVGVEELDKGGDEYVLLFESVEKTSKREEVSEKL